VYLALEGYRIGDGVRLSLLRDGARQEVTVTRGEAEEALSGRSPDQEGFAASRPPQ
jgi:hypothetical protein